MGNRLTYKRLGDYIQLVDIRNKDLKITNLLGVSVTKEFIPSIANTIGTNMSTYKVVKNNQFVYISDTSRRGDKIAIALLKTKEAIVSSIYTVFEIIDINELLPEYLMMWFKRPEFDHYARYKSHGSAREIFDWEEMCNVYLPIPPIEEQRKIVSDYETLTHRIKLNEQMIQKLEDTAQTIYRKIFVDDIDSDNLPEGWKAEVLSDISQYVNEKKSVEEIDESCYISTENMLKDKKGIELSSCKPDTGKGTKFKKDDVLVSNIRPYFKKLWRASFDGVSSNDVLCFRYKEHFNPAFLYYTLKKDDFFDYVMAGSNGVKMPRGDKKWIMEYPLIIPPKDILEEYQTISNYMHNYNVICRQEIRILKKLQSLLSTRII